MRKEKKLCRNHEVTTVEQQPFKKNSQSTGSGEIGRDLGGEGRKG